jgi:hypothetical protein
LKKRQLQPDGRLILTLLLPEDLKLKQARTLMKLAVQHVMVIKLLFL